MAPGGGCDVCRSPRAGSRGFGLQDLQFRGVGLRCRDLKFRDLRSGIPSLGI